MRMLRSLAAAVLAACFFALPASAALLIEIDKSAQVMTVTAERRAAVHVAGVDRPARLRHAGRFVQAVPHGEGSLQPRVGRRADAAFDLLHHARPRHPRHDAGAGDRPAGVARLRAARAGERARAVRSGQAGGHGQHRAWCCSAQIPGGGAPAVVRRAPRYEQPGYDDEITGTVQPRRVERRYPDDDRAVYFRQCPGSPQLYDERYSRVPPRRRRFFAARATAGIEVVRLRTPATPS